MSIDLDDDDVLCTLNLVFENLGSCNTRVVMSLQLDIAQTLAESVLPTLSVELNGNEMVPFHPTLHRPNRLPSCWSSCSMFLLLALPMILLLLMHGYYFLIVVMMVVVVDMGGIVAVFVVFVPCCEEQMRVVVSSS
jgi:hypothetical protein